MWCDSQNVSRGCRRHCALPLLPRNFIYFSGSQGGALSHLQSANGFSVERQISRSETRILFEG
jgi:hypothetical protein